MKIAIIGNGGREHALASQIAKSEKVKKIYCMPGNAGTQLISKNINIDIKNFEEIYKFVEENKIGLVIVGPEQPLVDGIVDYLTERNILVFGPNRKVAQLEGSKIFTKKICQKYNIPTANFGIFKNKKDTFKYLENVKFPIVIKADGLAAGKGVYICNNLRESLTATEEIFGGKFGKAEQILVEEFLEGDEMSFFVVSDGKTYKFFNTAQDHKRVGEGDTGKNTGGMGAYSPSGLINKNLKNKIIDKIINPTLLALDEIGEKYVGFLYAGLMIKNNEPFLIEYNVRMGDPECQTILPLLKTDLIDVIYAATVGKLNQIKIEWKNKKSLCIVLCSKGYPENYEKNLEIQDLLDLKINENSFIYHAGTIMKNSKIYAMGGRVLNFVNISDEYGTSRKELLNLIYKLKWKDGFFRSDIGYKVIDL